MDLLQTQRRTAANRYTILSRIETHGNSRFYRATHAESGRQVALREFEPAHCTTSDALAVLQKARSLSSRFLATLIDAAPVEGDTLYAAHALLHGEALTERLGRKGALPPAEAVALCVRALKGLDALHRRGLVHGGLRLSRIFHERAHTGWHVKLLGACVPSVTRDQVCGSRELLRFTPPEWLDGGAWTAQGDIWCVGAILYECITLHSPFVGESPKQIARGILAGEMVSLGDVAEGAPRALSDLVEKILSRDPAKRPVSVPVVLDKLLEIYPEEEQTRDKNREESWTRGQKVGGPAMVEVPVTQDSRTQVARRQRREVSRAWWGGASITGFIAIVLFGVLYARMRHRETGLPSRSIERVVPSPTVPIAPEVPLSRLASVAPGLPATGTSERLTRPVPTSTPVAPVRSSSRAVVMSHDVSGQDPGTEIGALEFRTPTACALILDGRDRGEVTALRVALEPGLHRLTCRARSNTQRLAFQVLRSRLTRVQITLTGEAEVTTEESHRSNPR